MKIVLATLLLFTSISEGSISVDAALKRNGKNRISALRQKGPEAYRELRQIAFDNEAPYQTRWRALMSMAWMGGPESQTDLEAALVHKDWFMKDAGLRAMVKLNPEKAKTWSRKLLKDKAMVVRTTAVDSIRELKDTESLTLLWEELYNKNNYRGDQSLWVRRHIVEALADLSTKGQEQRFVRVLDDKDPSLHLPAMRALERLTGQKPTQASRGFWKKWARQAAKAPASTVN